jgi:hypothetical protein
MKDGRFDSTDCKGQLRSLHREAPCSDLCFRNAPLAVAVCAGEGRVGDSEQAHPGQKSEAASGQQLWKFGEVEAQKVPDGEPNSQQQEPHLV